MSVFKRLAEERQRRRLAAIATEQSAKDSRDAALTALEAEAGKLVEEIIRYLETEAADAKACGYAAEVHRIRDDSMPLIGGELSFAYSANVMPSQVRMQFGFRVTIDAERQAQVSYICRERGRQPVTLIPTETMELDGKENILSSVEAALEKFIEAAEADEDVWTQQSRT